MVGVKFIRFLPIQNHQKKVDQRRDFSACSDNTTAIGNPLFEYLCRLIYDMIIPKTKEEIELMRESALIVSRTLGMLAAEVKPGVSTLYLDKLAEDYIRSEGAVPGFLGLYDFPNTLCTSPNQQVVHGIPNRKKVIRAGDLLKVDTGAYHQGYHGDSCITITVGKVSTKAAKLVHIAEAALYQGIEQVKPGNYLLDIAGAIEDYVKKNGYNVVEEFTGHGVGKNLHEEPAVFNFRTNQLPNVKLKPGMTLAIEPIVNAGSKHTRTLRDRWTVVTVDRCLSAQFEHTVLVTADGYEILTDRDRL